MDLTEVISLNNDKHLCDVSILKIVIDHLSEISRDKSSYLIDVDTNDEGLSIILSSKSNKSLMINFLLGGNWVNIYLGKEGAHYADDVKVSGEEQLEELIKQMELLLKGTVTESIYYFGNDMKKYTYELTYKANRKKFSNVTFYPTFLLTRQVISYQPWI